MLIFKLPFLRFILLSINAYTFLSSCRLLSKAINVMMIARAFPTLIYCFTLCQSENKIETQVYFGLKIYKH